MTDELNSGAETMDVRCVLIEAAKHYLEKSFGPYKKSVVDDAWKLLQMATVHAMSHPKVMDTEELRRAIEGDEPVQSPDWTMAAAHDIYSHIARSTGSIPAAARIIAAHAPDMAEVREVLGRCCYLLSSRLFLSDDEVEKDANKEQIKRINSLLARLEGR